MSIRSGNLKGFEGFSDFGHNNEISRLQAEYQLWAAAVLDLQEGQANHNAPRNIAQGQGQNVTYQSNLASQLGQGQPNPGYLNGSNNLDISPQAQLVNPMQNSNLGPENGSTTWNQISQSQPRPQQQVYPPRASTGSPDPQIKPQQPQSQPYQLQSISANNGPRFSSLQQQKSYDSQKYSDDNGPGAFENAPFSAHNQAQSPPPPMQILTAPNGHQGQVPQKQAHLDMQTNQNVDMNQGPRPNTSAQQHPIGFSPNLPQQEGQPGPPIQRPTASPRLNQGQQQQRPSGPRTQGQQ